MLSLQHHVLLCAAAQRRAAKRLQLHEVGAVERHCFAAESLTPHCCCRLNAEWKLGQADLDLISKGKEPLLAGLNGCVLALWQATAQTEQHLRLLPHAPLAPGLFDQLPGAQLHLVQLLSRQGLRCLVPCICSLQAAGDRCEAAVIGKLLCRAGSGTTPAPGDSEQPPAGKQSEEYLLSREQSLCRVGDSTPAGSAEQPFAGN